MSDIQKLHRQPKDPFTMDHHDDLLDLLKSIPFRRIHPSEPTVTPTDPPTPKPDIYSTIPDYHDIVLRSSSTSAAIIFLRDLTLLPTSSPTDKEAACDICREPYHCGEDPETPTRLPCGHVLGRKCVGNWIVPAGTQPNTTCPICRRDLFIVEDSSMLPRSPFEAGEAADWLQETELMYQSDPDPRHRLETLVHEVLRGASTKHPRFGMQIQALPMRHEELLRRVRRGHERMFRQVRASISIYSSCVDELSYIISASRRIGAGSRREERLSSIMHEFQSRLGRLEHIAELDTQRRSGEGD